ncbi:MAG TPA: hypothetical protein VFX92_00435 [Candidatus Krumholzibacteria bacterium]|nr:hypothetical protein [Candidatus Krumholzibacteria bacterium]
MRHRFIMPAAALILGALAFSGCLDEKTIEIVLTGETYADFSQDEDNANWTNAAVIDVAQELRDILEDNGYSVDDIESAFVTSVSYGVTSFSQAHDWEIGGSIMVARDAGAPVTAITYAAQSVQGALGQKIPAALQPDAVDLMNQALQDFLDGANPVLTFTVVNSSVAPAPSGADRMVFDWRAWLAIQVIVTETVEVPDPF